MAELTEKDRQQTLDRAITAGGVERMQLLRYLAARGCGVCGDPALTVEVGPKFTVELVRRPKPPFSLGTDDVSLRVTEEVRAWCQQHAPGRLLPQAEITAAKRDEP